MKNNRFLGLFSFSFFALLRRAFLGLFFRLWRGAFFVFAEQKTDF